MKTKKKAEINKKDYLNKRLKMLYNIFKKSREKEGKSNTVKKPTIIADIHEKNSLVLANLHQLGAEINLLQLKVGDYLIGDTIIERKTFSDFISSMLNKRLIEQLRNMQQYSLRLLILEGKNQIINEESKLNPNAIKGMILSISLDFNIPIIQTKNEEETALYLYLLAKKQLKPNQELSFHNRIPRTKKEQKQYILEAFPGIGPKTSKKLLKELKTIKNIINSDLEKLKSIMGKKADSFSSLLED
jgi:Fanconi anemia group M protein